MYTSISIFVFHSVLDHSMVSKTRDKLMDVARQLFAKKGIENTSVAVALSIPISLLSVKYTTLYLREKASNL